MLLPVSSQHPYELAAGMSGISCIPLDSRPSSAIPLLGSTISSRTFKRHIPKWDIQFLLWCMESTREEGGTMLGQTLGRGRSGSIGCALVLAVTVGLIFYWSSQPDEHADREGHSSAVARSHNSQSASDSSEPSKEN